MIRYTPYVFEDGSMVVVPDYIKDDINKSIENFLKKDSIVDESTLFSIILKYYIKTGTLISL